MLTWKMPVTQPTILQMLVKLVNLGERLVVTSRIWKCVTLVTVVMMSQIFTNQKVENMVSHKTFIPLIV